MRWSGLRDFKLYLDDIIIACTHILDYTAGYTFATFERDQKTIDAVIRNIEIIGEASRKIPETIKSRYPEISWRESTAMRNIVAHEYFGIDLEIIWQTIKQDIPKLKSDIEKISE